MTTARDEGAAIETHNGATSRITVGLIVSGDFFKTHVLDYKGGARYPRLEKVEGKPDLLAEIVKPKTK